MQRNPENLLQQLTETCKTLDPALTPYTLTHYLASHHWQEFMELNTTLFLLLDTTRKIFLTRLFYI